MIRHHLRVNALTVETLIAIIALNVFQMRDYGSFKPQPFCFIRPDMPTSLQSIDPCGIDCAPVSFGQRLVEMRPVGKRGHHADILLHQLTVQKDVIVKGRHMVEASFQYGLAQQLGQQSGAPMLGQLW
jgi:hypothetical protein